MNKFGRWSVLSCIKEPYWQCRCDCGTVRTVRASSIKSGHSKSCGCLNIDNHTSHGLRRHPLYNIWHAMVTRCSNKCQDTFRHRYYDRGIRVCDEWQHSPTAFIQWAEASGYSKGLELDRLNNAGDYCPSNCRFVTRQTNVCNTDIRKDNTSGHKGVSFIKTTGKWRAYKIIEGKHYHLGYYVNKDEAIKARNTFTGENNGP